MNDEPQPWWLRALAPLRSEAAMFRVLVWVGGGRCGVRRACT